MARLKTIKPMVATLKPLVTAKPQSETPRTGGGDQPESEGYAEWCEKAIKRFEGVKAAVMAEQCIYRNRGANMFGAIDCILLRDEEFPHMIGDLRLALNAIGHHFGIIHRPKARAA